MPLAEAKQLKVGRGYLGTGDWDTVTRRGLLRVGANGVTMVGLSSNIAQGAVVCTRLPLPQWTRRMTWLKASE